MASILNVFEPKTKIKSSEVNENFELVQKDVSEMGQALNTYVEGEIASVQSTVSSVQATLQENINTVSSKLSNIYDDIAPNYGAGYNISNGFTAPKAGWCYFGGIQDGSSGVHVGGRYLEISYDSGDGQSRGNIFVYVGKGTIVNGFNRVREAIFFPCKGAA
ncbi:MAG: hypothetical protein II304_03115 [Bacteroidales bacterium]|nr:hypothetical protein [Bacteroidales bacterium]